MPAGAISGMMNSLGDVGHSLFLTSDGRVIWRKGIEPDVQVSLPSGVAPLVPDAEREMGAQEL